MSQTVPTTEAEAFYQFLGTQIQNGLKDASPERCVEEFRKLQDEVNQFVAESASWFEQADRGELRRLEPEEIKAEVRRRSQLTGD